MTPSIRPAIAGISALFLFLCACGGGGGGGGSSGGGSGSGGSGSAPVFTSSGSASVAENITGSVYTAAASGTGVTYGVSGTGDSALFSINAATGALSFISPPNYEWPRDANRDNIYTVNLTATNATGSATLAVSIAVTNRAGRVSTRRVAQGFSGPLYLLGRGDNSGRVLVVEKAGLVRVLDPLTGIIEAQPFMDLGGQLSTDGERGLLGLALAPDFATSGTLYAYLTVPGGDIQLRKFTATASGTGTSAGDVILTIAHSQNSNHNGGWIGFDANGYLIIAVGDGGGSNDPSGNGQNTNVLLGKMLRIDPRTDSFPADPNRDYAIPTTNPFAVSGGAPEVWHWGLRNAFRNSFDRTTGNFYIADVGQGAVEEINLVRPSDPGLNFGWVLREGTRVLSNPTATGLTVPVTEYSHGSGALQGNSVTGGYVYRGPVTALQGHYVFGDFVAGRIWSVLASSLVQGVTLSSAQFTIRTGDFAPAAGAIGNISSFGEDETQNLYIVDYDGDIFLVDEVDEGA